MVIRESGVVLRGQGPDESDGTLLYATGTERRNIVEVRGQGGPELDTSTASAVTDMYVPVGAHSFTVEDSSGYEVGDSVIVRRNGNASWIHEIDMDQIVHRPGAPPGATQQWSPFVLGFDRIITQIEGNTVTVDAPVANAIESRWGGGEIVKYSDPGRIEDIGVENFRVEVEFDPSVTEVHQGEEYYADENKATDFVVINNAKNVWVREISAYHLETSLVTVDRNAKWVTIQDNEALEMVSVLTGGRRYSYNYVGQLALTQRSYAETARHAFVVGSRVPGPNVFLSSSSAIDYGSSEPHHRWSVGGLFDNIDTRLDIQDRGWLGSGHGWSGANYVTWNTEGRLISQSPPTAQNYAIGHAGTKGNPFLPNANDPRPRDDGYWEHEGQHVDPQSFMSNN